MKTTIGEQTMVFNFSKRFCDDLQMSFDLRIKRGGTVKTSHVTVKY